MKKMIISAIICLLSPVTMAAQSCKLLNDNTDWVKQYNACPSSPTAAYNAIIQLNAQGNTQQAKKLLTTNRKKFRSFQPLKKLASEMHRWSAEPYRLIAQLTDADLKKWVSQLPPPVAFSGESPKRADMPPLPQLVKGEFETTSQFKQRVRQAKQNRQAASDRRESKYQQAVENYNFQVTQYNRKLAQDKTQRPKKIMAKQRELLAENIALVFGKPILNNLSYNADKEIFFGRLTSSHGNFDQQIKFSVPLEHARNLKQNAANITPELYFSVENNRLAVKHISVEYKNEHYEGELTSQINTTPMLTAQLDDSQLKTAYTSLSMIKATLATSVDDSAFFNTALTLEADPELARLKQQQAELARKQKAAKQQQAVLAERARLKQQIELQQQALASLGGGLGAQYNGLKPSIKWAFKPAQANKDMVMVIIGNRNYKKGVPLVHYAYNDARAMREFALNSLGLQPEDIIYEEDATKGVMEGIFKSTLPARVKAGKKKVLVYFSGHGMAAGNDAKLLPVDARPNTAAVTGYSRNSMMKQLASLGVKSTVILDACYTGTSKDGAPLLAGKPVFKAPKRAWVPKNTTLISASSGNQIAWMDEKKGHSLMTYYLLKGLQGSADKNKNGKIDSGELAAYLKVAVNRAALLQHEQPQQPEVLGANQVLVRY